MLDKEKYRVYTRFIQKQLTRDGAVWKLVGLITRRSQVQILFPLLKKKPLTRKVKGFFFFVSVFFVTLSFFSHIIHYILLRKRSFSMLSIPLCKLKKDQCAIVEGISCPSEHQMEKSEIIRRFLDLGFCQGTPVKCINTGIFKNPHAYQIRGSVIAIRNEDAQMILVHAADPSQTM